MSRWDITGTTEMKKQIFLFALLLGSFMTFAQQQIATLQHGDSISMFYGVDAFIQAHTAADNGDIITLSSGTFDTCRITKAITLRGAGAMPDSNNHAQTIFNSLKIGIYTNNDSLGRFEMEGIFVNNLMLLPCTSPKFIKCAFTVASLDHYTDNYSQLVNNPQFINCVIKECCYFGNSYCRNVYFVNSIVGRIQQDNSIIFSNSIAKLGGTGISHINAYNSILVFTTTMATTIVSGGLYYNNILINSMSYSNAFSGISNNTNKRYQTIASVFENWDGTFSYDNVYTLKDSVANDFRGSDGSEVGIYGGVMPFSLKPSYMYVKKCNVANRSTADGKLSVDIEVVTE